MPGVFGVDEDVEEQAVGFEGAGGPDGAVGGLPLGNQVGLDVEVYEEGQVGVGGGGHCLVWFG